MKPYFQRDGVTLFHADCRDVLPTIEAGSVDLVLTDPPYGISYSSGMTGRHGGTALDGIVGDDDTTLRDFVVNWAGDTPQVIFGSWKIQRPENVRAVLIWDKGDHVGMGDLSLPWKPNTEEVYIIGNGFSGHRGSSVLRFNAPVTWNSVRFGRKHPHEKPVGLLKHFIEKLPGFGTILDPFAGSGTTLRAAMDLGRKAIGIEISEKYCEIAARRLEQRNLQFAEAM